MKLINLFKRSPYISSIIAILIVVIILIASVYFLVQPFDKYTIGLDLSKTGQIGDTIGGITAPIINLLGSFLVFLSFMVQINANKVQMDQFRKDQKVRDSEFNFQFYFQLFKDIKTEFQATTYISGEIQFEGLSAIRKFCRSYSQSRTIPMIERLEKESVFNSICGLTNQIVFVTNMIIKDKNHHGNVKILQLIDQFYKTNLKENLKMIVDKRNSVLNNSSNDKLSIELAINLLDDLKQFYQ